MNQSLAPTPTSLKTFYQRYHSILFPTMLFLGWRFFVLIIGLLSTSFIQVYTPNWVHENEAGVTYDLALPPNAPLAALVEPWHRYDSAWYIKNAIQGYLPDTGIVFPPFYSLLIRLAVVFFAGNYVLAAIIVSNIACLCAFILLYHFLTQTFNDVGISQRTLICLVCFPTAFFLVAPYAEALYLMLALGALIAVNDKRWWAAILTFLLALTRLQGVVICLPLGWIALRSLRESGWRAALPASLAAAGNLLGVGLFLLNIQLNHFGALSSAFTSGWQSSAQMPWIAPLAYLNRALTGQALWFEHETALILLIFIGLSFFVLRLFRFEYALYTWGTLAIFLTLYYDGPQFQSNFRHVLVLFPCFVVMAFQLKSRRLLLYILIGLVWQIILIVRFTHWIWVA